MSPAASTPRRRGPRTDAAHNDVLILRTAARVLAEDPNATIQRIAAEAGLARVTVYRRWPNRDAIRRAVFDTAAAEVQARLDEALAADLDAPIALRQLIIEMAATIQRYPMLATSSEWQPMPGDRHRPSPPPISRRMHQTVFALIRRGQQTGQLRRDLPPELLPQAITGTLHTVTRFARSLGTDPDRIGEHVADLLLNGFTTDRNPSREPTNTPRQ
ncbi:TetR/AcrR family transcriptional regulator [Glycomyces sp. NPDC047369]